MNDELLANARAEVERIERFVADGHCSATVPQIQYLCNLGCSLEQLRGINKAMASAMISQLVDAKYDEEFPFDDDVIDVSYESLTQTRKTKGELPDLMNANPSAGNFEQRPPREIPYIPNLEAPLSAPPAIPTIARSISRQMSVGKRIAILIGIFVVNIGLYLIFHGSPSSTISTQEPAVTEAFDYQGLDPEEWGARMYEAKSNNKQPYWPTEKLRQANIELPVLVRGGIYKTPDYLYVRPRMSSDPESDHGKTWSSLPGVDFQCISVDTFDGLLFYGVRAYRFDGPADGYIEASQLAYITAAYDRTDKILTSEDMQFAEAQRIAQEQSAAIAAANAEHIANNQAAAQSRGRANNQQKADAARAAGAAQQQFRENNAAASRETINRARASGIIR